MKTVRRLEPANRRIRARHNGEWLLDTTDTWILLERERHPTLALPRSELSLLRDEPATPDDVDGVWVDLGGEWQGTGRVWRHGPADIPD